MKKILLVFLFATYSLMLSAQADIVKIRKPLRTWIYTKENTEQRGLLIGYSATTLLIYPGSTTEFYKEKSPQTKSLIYENISLIRVKKINGLIKGLLIGGGIGVAPVVLGYGGAIVAVFTLPVGIITGSIVGATSKKKYEINGDITAFQKFIAKLKK